MTVEQFDAIIIGAGQSGGPLSTALGAAGWKTAIIEREHAGGTCVNTGCTPTKTMVASARAAYVAGRSAEYGIRTDGYTVDLEVVRQRKRDIVEMFREGSQSSIESAKNVELIFGEASFGGEKTIDVSLNDGGSRRLAASTIVINVGGRPRSLDVPGLSDAGPLNSTTIMELDAVPGRLLIVGGGPVSLEFAQMFQRFGSEVTIVVRGERLLNSEDEDISEALTEIFAEDGIRVVFEAKLQEVSARDGEYRARVETADGTEEIMFDRILVAVGRVPNSDRLNLEATGIETDDRGYIQVDEQFETAVEGVYAIGDINGGIALTHVSYDDFRILRDNLLDGCGRTSSGRVIPYTIFTDPQLGRIGMTERQAREQNIDTLVFKMPMSSVARALEVDETRGLMKAIVDRSTGKIVGASILGIEGGEIAGALQLAMMGELHYTALRDGMFSHPTLIESLNNLFSSPAGGESS